MVTTKSPVKILEKQITEQVRDFLKYRGWRPVRTQFAFSPGSFQTGEPGMADYLFLRGTGPSVALALWIEFKGPRDKRRCTCAVGKQCKQCRQKAWQERERQRGFTVWVVDDFEWFAGEYARVYGWLHSGDQARGQLDLLTGVAVK